MRRVCVKIIKRKTFSISTTIKCCRRKIRQCQYEWKKLNHMCQWMSSFSMMMTIISFRFQSDVTLLWFKNEKKKTKHLQQFNGWSLRSISACTTWYHNNNTYWTEFHERETKTSIIKRRKKTYKICAIKKNRTAINKKVYFVSELKIQK